MQQKGYNWLSLLILSNFLSVKKIIMTTDTIQLYFDNALSTYRDSVVAYSVTHNLLSSQLST
jgi:hypothetical protein